MSEGPNAMKQGRTTPLRESTGQKEPRLRRCLNYYYFLCECVRSGTKEWIRSHELARVAGVSSSLVRRDLESIGIEGVCGVGTRSVDVIAGIEEAFCLNKRCPAVLVGVGDLGGALLRCPCLSAGGVHIEAVFDWDGRRIGTKSARTVLPLKRLAGHIVKHRIVLGIIATPPSMAQDVANTMVHAGVTAVWNFASVPLVVPPRVILRNQSPEVGLAAILAALKDRSSASPHTRASGPKTTHLWAWMVEQCPRLDATY
jgi:redox-sensing transcriptional repressor